MRLLSTISNWKPIYMKTYLIIWKLQVIHILRICFLLNNEYWIPYSWLYWYRAYVVLPVSKIRWENRISSPDLFSEIIIYYEVWKWGSKSAYRLIYLWYIIYRIKLMSSWWYITAVFLRQNKQVEQRFSVSFLLPTYLKNIFLSITVTQ